MDRKACELADEEITDCYRRVMSGEIPFEAVDRAIATAATRKALEWAAKQYLQEPQGTGGQAITARQPWDVARAIRKEIPDAAVVKMKEGK